VVGVEDEPIFGNHKEARRHDSAALSRRFPHSTRVRCAVAACSGCGLSWLSSNAASMMIFPQSWAVILVPGWSILRPPKLCQFEECNWTGRASVAASPRYTLCTAQDAPECNLGQTRPLGDSLVLPTGASQESTSAEETHAQAKSFRRDIRPRIGRRAMQIPTGPG